MGAALSSLLSLLHGSARPFTLVLVGLDNAGKTTALYQLQLGQPVTTTPTVGCNVEELVHGSVRFKAWDLGGQTSLREHWAAYCSGGVDGIVFVVDAVDRGRVYEARQELRKMMSLEACAGAALLVLANKQDMEDAMTPAQISDELKLIEIKVRPWHIQGACALNGAGLREGLGWLAGVLTAEAGDGGAAAPVAGAGGGMAESASDFLSWLRRLPARGV